MLFNCDFSIAVEWRFCDFPLFRFVGFVNLFCVYDVVAYDFDFVRCAFACVFGKVNQNLFSTLKSLNIKKKIFFIVVSSSFGAGVSVRVITPSLVRVFTI